MVMLGSPMSNNSSDLLNQWGRAAIVGEVRMDVKGNLAVVTAISTDGILLQLNHFKFQLIPFYEVEIFQDTTFTLGVL